MSLGTVLTIGAPPAAASETVARSCEGARAYRCAWLNVDFENHRLRGYGSVRNTTDQNVQVAVLVVVDVATTSGWRRVAQSNNISAPNSVSTSTGLADCITGRTYRVTAFWRWGGEDGTEEARWSSAFGC